jgi:arylsulfatase B
MARAIIFAACTTTALGFGSPGVKKPNLVFMLADDLGWADVSWHSSQGEAAQMPNMDTLIEEGVELNRAYSYSWCGPARSSLLSGRLPPHVMMNYTDEYYNPEDPDAVGNGIPAGMTTIGTKMKEAGYHTVYNGKWGAGYQGPDQMPLARGFDSYLGYLADSVDHYTMQRPPKSTSTPGGCENAGFTDPYITDFWRNNGPANALNNSGEWLDHMTLKQTLQDLEEHNTDVPLFLMHAFASTHTPLDPPEDMLEQYSQIEDYSRKAYLTMASFIDYGVGEVVNALKEKGMWENTVLVFSSDNGGPTYAGGSATLNGGASNHPLKGSKTGSFDGGLRVASFVSGGLVPLNVRGTMIDDYIHVADWYSTFAALANVDPTDKTAADNALPPVDSINVWPLISGQDSTPIRTELYIAATILIQDQWKLITGSDQGNINKRMRAYPTMVPFNYYLNGYGEEAALQMEMIKTYGDDTATWPEDSGYRSMDCATGCLFDIQKDEAEANEIGDQFPEVREQMIKRLAVLNEGSYDPYRGPNEVDVEQCKAQQAAGFYGPSSIVDTWKYQIPLGN